jgi:hypothetical protein
MYDLIKSSWRIYLKSHQISFHTSRPAPSRSSIRIATTSGGSSIIRESPFQLQSSYMLENDDNASKSVLFPGDGDNNKRKQFASSSIETTMVRRRSSSSKTLGIITPTFATAVATLTAAIAILFTLPTVSNAIISIPTIAAVTSTTTTAATTASVSYSTWVTSLTDSGFYQAFSLVFLSEIGDKTFFVAALLAAKLSRLISFVGSLGALAVMTVISVIIGQVFHAVPSEIANGVPLDDVAAVLAFTYFGIKILTEALFDDVGERGGKSAMDEEFQEAEETVEGSDTINKASAG